MAEIAFLLSTIVVLFAAGIVAFRPKASFSANLEGRIGALQAQEGQLTERLKGLDEERLDAERKIRERDGIELELKRLKEDVDPLQKRVEKHQEELIQKLDELAENEKNLENINAAIQEGQKKLEQVQQEKNDTQRQLDQAEVQNEKLRNEKLGLQNDIKELEQRITSNTNHPQSNKILQPSAFDDLLNKPLITGDPEESIPFDFEAEAFQHTLETQGFKFSKRLINAFHTSLLTQDISSLTVLAGVSGTGKSTLPRLYAEHVGMYFIPVPVEPRWDSPQDLFGFMNHLEERYVATELGRGLHQFDITNEGGFSDQMLLVLLDEMNLARVEYYFSEFLSRLEMRRSVKDWTNVEKTDKDYLDASMEIFSGQEEPKIPSIRLFAGPNILFTGSMNEDETTNNLSDKVVDRSNIIHFGSPQKLTVNTNAERTDEANGKLRYSVFKNDIKTLSLDNAESEVGTYIRGLNNLYQGVNKHFGHRMFNSTLHYVLNHPEGSLDDRSNNPALSDQIVMRFLPRLNGLEIIDFEEKLKDIQSYIETADPKLAGMVNDTINKSQSGNIFQWQGFDWDTEADE